MSNTTLYLFRNDLRLKDNPGLSAACNSGQPVLLLFILDNADKNWRIGSASRWWLHHSLQSLHSSIEKHGGSLILRKGNTVSILDEIINQANVNKLYFSRTYEPAQVKIEENIFFSFHDQIEVKQFGGYLLFEPEQIKTGNDQPYKVFTPFWKKCLKQPEPCLSKQKTSKLKIASCFKVRCDELNDWCLLPNEPDWASGLRDKWQPGEDGAHYTLKEFIQSGLQNYDVERNRPDRDGTSCLSPYLHCGEIAPARIWYEVKQQVDRYKSKTKSGMTFLRELGWRDFSTHLLYNWPDLPNSPFRPEYKNFPWKKNRKILVAWQKGQTGYPIVDAGMRQLWHSGWMHNRVRMIVASFLVKHLLIHWREGEDWFWDTLVDADLANNSVSWQWIAGSGADAAPYFRIFNPILQGKKFDPNGDYVRRWVPEVAMLPGQYIHEPWITPEEVLNKANIELGREYPLPIIEHDVGRYNALYAFRNFKKMANKPIKLVTNNQKPG